MKYRLVLFLTAVPLWPAIGAAADAPSATRTEWVKLAPTVSPAPRAGMAMAYDPVSGRIVLFGGAAGLSYFSDTWTFDGVTWTKLAPPLSPPARAGAGMAYDAALQRLVMFGGFTATAGYLGDTWIFDGALANWAEINQGLSPPAVTEPNVFTDPLNGRVDMYGGFSKSTGYVSGTWQFNGIRWRQLQPASSPSARCGAVAAFDPIANKVVLFGGLADLDADNTWTWDGVNWTELSLAHQPPVLAYAASYGAAAFDPGLRLVVVFANDGGGEHNGTWAWTGSDWVQGHPVHSPSPRESAGMAYDAAIGHVILFGGENFARPYGDTWELVPAP